MKHWTEHVSYVRGLFEGQTRRNGEPAIGHMIRVAETCPPGLELVGLYHDVLEDTTVSTAALRAQGLSLDELALIGRLTRQDAEPYMEYIKRVAHAPAAITVKLADLRDNFRGLLELGVHDEKQAVSLAKRYIRAFAYLSGRVNE